MITSVSNGRVKNVIALNGKAKARKEQKVFVVEGLKMFQEVPAEKVREIYLTTSMKEKESVQEKLRECACSIEEVSEEVFARMSDTTSPQGILCIVEQESYSLDTVLEAEQGFWLVLEDIQDPGNLGTILRTGEGAGISGVILSRNTADIYNPKTIRSTMGSLFRVPFVYADTMEEALGALHTREIQVYAAHLQGERYYDAFDYRSKCAFLIGNEGNGLTESTAAMADEYLRIPMAGKVESLNAAVAASILMYEVYRQRR